MVLIGSRFGAAMTDFFTLNPRYKRYELGVYPLEYQTVYGVQRHRFGRTLVTAILLILMYTTLTKYDMGFTGRASDLLPNMLLIISLFVCAIWVIPTEIFSLIRTVRINKSYARLVHSGILIDGQIYEIRIREQKVSFLESWLNKSPTKGFYFVVFIYRFNSPEQKVVYGKQTVVRVYQNLIEQPLPLDGTAIRILYTDDNIHVML